MPPDDDPAAPLRAALTVTPDNGLLRRHLADTLMGLGRYVEAIGEFRLLLEQAPHDADLHLHLADAYFQAEKLSEAAVILESLVDQRDPSAAACLLYAKLALREGRAEDAVDRYKQACDLDATVRDEGLASQLGISPDGDIPYGDDDDEVYEGRVRMRGGEVDGDFRTELERPQIRFDDVGGMAELKEEIRVKIIYPLERPEIYKAYGKELGGGIMMYGPPGCGKTYLARATAGEIDASFLSIGINDVLDMWMGNSEKRLHQVFEQGRDHAPCVLFFDEVDALGGRRSDMQSGTARQLINQFLAELDGAEHSNDGLLVLAATNAPWHVDPAFRRPGRFDRVLFVPPPDELARADILRLHCQGKPIRDIDYAHLAKKTPEYSGADMKAMLDIAIETKLIESINKGGAPRPITGKDLLRAAKSHRPTTKEWFSSARNYALYANQGGLYDDVLKYLKM